MSKGKIEIRFAGKCREVPILRDSIVIGRLRDCDLCLPFPWISEKHLIVQHDAGLVRVRSAQPNAKASIGSQSIGMTSEMLPTGATLDIPAPDGSALSMRFDFQMRASHGAVLEHAATTSEVGVTDEPEVVGINAIEERNSLFASAPANTATTRRNQPSQKRPDHRVLIAGSAAVLLVVAIVFGAMIWNGVSRSKQNRLLVENMRSFDASLQKARDLIRSQRFVEAKVSLEMAQSLIAHWPTLADRQREVDLLFAKPEIKFGANGYVKMEGQWLPAEMAKAWQISRDRDDPKIASLFTLAKDAMKHQSFEDGRTACDSALAIIQAEPVKGHPLFNDLSKLRLELQNQIVAAEMTAKGLVLYKDKWMSTEQKFRTQQTEKGLVEYDGKWMSREDAFAAEQIAKGLVLYNGKWMTPDEQMVAKGFVKFEDKWITLAEKNSILDQRAQAQREAEARALAERQRLAQEAETRRQEAARVESLKSTAYDMSQTFIKRQLKAPGSAQFPKFDDPDVKVVFSEGWFIVKAPVDSQNSFGALLRGTYLCKLRPTVGDKWECEFCDMVDR